jgi:hypothetical protein
LPYFEKDELNFQLRFDTKIYLYENLGGGFRMYETYAIQKRPPVLKVLGNWTVEKGMSIYYPFIWERRTDMFGIELTNAVVSFSVFVRLEYYDNGRVSGASGFFIDILSILGGKSNYTFTTATSPDGKWGAPNPDGTWNGLIGMLVRGEADVVTCGPSMTLERSAVSDMSIPMLPDIGTAISPVSKGIEPHWWVYTEVFPLFSWFALCVMMVTVSLGFLIINVSGWCIYIRCAFTLKQSCSPNAIQFLDLYFSCGFSSSQR